MTIDKSKLIELLVDKTGMDEEQVEEQLSLLVLRVQQAAVQGKDFEIQGFGTFHIKGDALHFEPSKSLETEINHKYAGMKPIELIGAFKDMPPYGEDDSQTKTDDASLPAQTIPDLPQKRERSIEEILGIGQAPAQPEKSDEPAESSSGLQPDEQKESSADSFVSDDDTSAAAEDPFDIDIDEDEFIFGPPDEPEDEAESLKEKDPIGRVLIICVTLLVLGVAGWSVYELDLLHFSADGTSVASQPPPAEHSIQTTSEQTDEAAGQTGGVTLPEAENPNMPGSGNQGSGNAGTNRENANNIPDKSAVYGLKGSVNPEANDGYTIIVHSLRQFDKAQQQQAKLTSQGYRVMLTEAVVNGQTYWRVSLGQFETLTDAKEAIQSLPEHYASNHFIKRIK